MHILLLSAFLDTELYHLNVSCALNFYIILGKPTSLDVCEMDVLRVFAAEE